MADVEFRLEFKPEGFQQVLNSGGTRALLHSHASGVVGRMGGFGYERSFTATSFGHGPRPAVAVFAHAYPDPIRQAYANHRLEGAM